MKPNIGIAVKNIEAIVLSLTTLLATQVSLYTKTRKFHWNICGNSFMEHHKLFEDHYKALEKSIDEVAERVSKLGKNVIGTMMEFSELSIIREHPGKYPTGKHMIEELLTDHEIIIIELRKWVNSTSHDDAGTADLLTSLMKEHETMAWTLRRYLS